MVGYLYERTHTRQIADLSQLAKPLPIMAGFFLFFVFGSAGLPGLSGFVGEFLSLLGLFAYSHWLAAIAATGVILAAAYLLWMFQRTMFNDRGDDEVKPERGPLRPRAGARSSRWSRWSCSSSGSASTRPPGSTSCTCRSTRSSCAWRRRCAPEARTGWRS